MAWTKAKTAVAAGAALIVLISIITIVVNAGLFESRTYRVYAGGINEAHRYADPLFTYPAGDDATRQYLVELFAKFRPTLDAARALKSDTELAEPDTRRRMIYIYGTPENHSFFRQICSRLPLVFESDGVVVGNKKCLGRDVGAIFVCPNPVDPSRRLVIYGAVSPEALKNMNGVFHGPTDYVVFNDTTRQYRGAQPSDCFLLAGAFDKSDPVHWRVDEDRQLLPPEDLRRAIARVIVDR